MNKKEQEQYTDATAHELRQVAESLEDDNNIDIIEVMRREHIDNLKLPEKLEIRYIDSRGKERSISIDRA